MYFFQIELIVVGLLCAAMGYAFGLRETKRRLKAHQEVTDRLMNAGISASSAHRLTRHDDMIDAAALFGTVYPSYGGISRSSSPFTATGIRNQVNVLSGSAMQNAVTYSSKIKHFDIFGEGVRLGAQQLKEEPDAKN